MCTTFLHVENNSERLCINTKATWPFFFFLFFHSIFSSPTETDFLAPVKVEQTQTKKITTNVSGGDPSHIGREEHFK